ncbi:hypothetical protein EVA_18197 [gut metagenome]|uniref:Uncharacterized protein n=1 Tax=gut metagenome TaxID=749906 RepID=J9FVV0_9ZZZZ
MYYDTKSCFSTEFASFSYDFCSFLLVFKNKLITLPFVRVIEILLM